MPDPFILREILRDLRRPGYFPAKTEPYQINETHRRWPIIVYRTGYAAGSEANWETLVAKIHSEVIEKIKEAAVPYVFDGEEPTATDQEKVKYERLANDLLELLDFRAISDAATLDGASHDKLREQYTAFLQQEGLADTIQCQRPFFVADTKVLTDDLKWIKALDMPYEPHPEWYNERDPQRYFGWMKMVTNGITELYSELSGFEMGELAPATIGGIHLEVWKPR